MRLWPCSWTLRTKLVETRRTSTTIWITCSVLRLAASIRERVSRVKWSNYRSTTSTKIGRSYKPSFRKKKTTSLNKNSSKNSAATQKKKKNKSTLKKSIREVSLQKREQKYRISCRVVSLIGLDRSSMTLSWVVRDSADTTLRPYRI